MIKNSYYVALFIRISYYETLLIMISYYDALFIKTSILVYVFKYDGILLYITSHSELPTGNKSSMSTIQSRSLLRNSPLWGQTLNYLKIPSPAQTLD